MPPRGEWYADARDGGRALRATWHLEQGCVVLSTWKGSRCTGTARLSPQDAARLVGHLAAGLAEPAASPQRAADGDAPQVALGG